MFPVLVEFWGIKIYTYGLLVALGALVAYFILLKLASREGLDKGKVENVMIVTLLSGLLGGRLAYVIEHPEQIKGFLDALAIWNGGMDFFGGLALGLVGALGGVFYYKLPLWKTADMSVIALSIAHAVGRLGCTSAGCCYGKPFPAENTLPGIHLSPHFPFFYVVFPEGAVAPPYMPLYPTQLMEMLGLLVIFFLLLAIYRRKKYDGQVFATYMLLYGVLRFFLEFYRGVTPPISGLGLTWNQLVSILMVVVSFILMLTLQRRAWVAG